MNRQGKYSNLLGFHIGNELLKNTRMSSQFVKLRQKWSGFASINGKYTGNY